MFLLSCFFCVHLETISPCQDYHLIQQKRTLALSFDGTFPRFTQKAKKQKIENKELTIYYDMQCPFVYQSLEIVKQYCEINNVPILMIQVDTLQKAKDLPCVFNNWAVFYHGEFETVNLLDKNTLTRLLKK